MFNPKIIQAVILMAGISNLFQKQNKNWPINQYFFFFASGKVFST